MIKEFNIECLNRTTIPHETKIVSSFTEAEALSGIDRRTIKCICDNEMHYAHGDGYKRNLDGSISMASRYLPWDFHYIQKEPLVALLNKNDPDLSIRKFYSHTKACKFLGLSKPTYYRLLKDNYYDTSLSMYVVNIPIKDVHNEEWLSSYRESEELKSNLKRLQK